MKMKTRFSKSVSLGLVCGVVSLSASADTLFAPLPGTNDIFNAAAWTNGFPKIANSPGTIASNGIFSAVFNANETTPGTVTVEHVAGKLTPSNLDWYFYNASGGTAYHWNQEGGEMGVRLLKSGAGVSYTLSGSGKITASAGGSRIQPFNSGIFRQRGGTMINMGVEQGYGYTVELSGGNILGCGKNIPSQALWGHGSSSAKISISGTHSISFDSGVSAANAILLTDGAQLVFDPAWKGSWHHAGFTEADWITALSDTGVKVGTTQVTADNFNDLFTVAQAGQGGSSIQLGMREVGATPALPAITSVGVTAHFDASNINADGGIIDPGPGSPVHSWSDLVSTKTLLENVTAPHFVPFAGDGIGECATVRFISTAAGGDMLYNNNMSITARVVYAVATMKENNSVGLSTLMANNSLGLYIRQADGSEVPSYFAGNGGDFMINNSTGIFHINGNPRLDIPGGFDVPHVVKAVRNSAVEYAGLRFSESAVTNRCWNGDIAEVLILDGVPDGNDTAAIDHYLADKYALKQVVDERLIDTRQVADTPFRDMRLRPLGVNFHYSAGSATAGTVHGIGFDNITLSGGTPPAGPFTLSANQPGPTLTLDFPFTTDNGARTQSVTTMGVDSSTLNKVINEFFYLGGTHPSATMTFSGMGVTNQVYVQVFGGDAGWSGDIDVAANDAAVGRWMSVSDGKTTTASIFAFTTATDSSGRLKLAFTGVNHFAGISGIVLTEAVPWPPAGTIIMIR